MRAHRYAYANEMYGYVIYAYVMYGYVIYAYQT